MEECAKSPASSWVVFHCCPTSSPLAPSSSWLCWNAMLMRLFLRTAELLAWCSACAMTMGLSSKLALRQKISFFSLQKARPSRCWRQSNGFSTWVWRMSSSSLTAFRYPTTSLKGPMISLNLAAPSVYAAGTSCTLDLTSKSTSFVVVQTRWLTD